ncbi:MAG: DUF2334 domain-containing protein [Bacillota bacterium]|nr:DUF2334 domain-containing protein [Bacillota bacterium]
MMFKAAAGKYAIITGFIYFLLLQLYIPSAAVYGIGNTGTDGSNKSALLLYGSSGDNMKQELPEYIDLAREYCAQVGTAEIKDYTSELLIGVRYVFITGAADTEVNEKLASDLKNFTGRILWIGGGIEKYSSYGLTKGFEIIGYSEDASEVYYSDENDKDESRRILTGRRQDVPEIRVTDPAAVKNYGTCIMGNKEMPLAVNNGDLWCFAFVDTGGELQPVFRDILNRAFNVSDSEGSGIYIKLNNISPISDLEALKAAAATLQEQNIPFIMELRPVFVNTDFEQMKKYAAVVKEMQSMGGTAVMGNLQGWKIKDEWNQSPEGNSPLSGSEDMVPEKLMETAVKAYVQYGVYPVGFSAPIDALFDNDLNKVLKHFSMFLKNSSWQGYFSNIAPGSSWQGKYIGSKEGTENFSENAVDLEGSNFALEFDSRRELESMKKSIQALKQQNIRFLDLRNLDSDVNFGDLKIEVKNGEFLIRGSRASDQVSGIGDEDKPLGTGVQAESNGLNKTVRNTMTFVLVVVGIFLFTFLLAFIAGKRTDRRKHLR